MDLGNDVDLSNNNIMPLWKRRTDNCKIPQDSRKPRPSSYHTNGVTTTDFPVEECAFTLSQPAEKLVVTAPCPGKNTAVLKHVLHKPSKKSRVVRSISIGHISNGRFSLSKFKFESGRSASLDKRVRNGEKHSNGWPEECVRDPQALISRVFSLSLPKDKMSFHLSSPEGVPHTPNNNNHLQLSFSPPSSPCPPAPRTPSHSSTSSIPSLTSDDPPTPRSSSPADSLPRQSSPSQDARRTSSSSPSPSLSPCPSVVLSTHSPAALKMGTQQLIPKGLASDTRQSKPTPSGQQGQGLTGLLGSDTSKRTLKTLSMVETGAYFSTGRGHGEATDGENESPGALRRGLRSTSYRKAVVSGVDLEAQSLSQPVMKGLDGDNKTPPAGPSGPCLVKQTSPGAPKPDSPRTQTPTGTGKSKIPEKRNLLTPQRTFDSEEEELYQNYQEKALHNDSDEDADSREPQAYTSIVVQYRPIRTSWSQLSVVKKSGLFDRMSQEERKRQEAIFEVISSEHSYLHSLEILIRMFKNSTELSDAMTKTEHHHLFSNIVDVCEASKKFFKELEEKHQHSIVIDDISDIVCTHAESNFDPYVTYCSNEVYQQRTLQRLLAKNPVFKEVLTRIEGHPDCRNLPMISFLILPMQRVTRLPLLMDTICQKILKESTQYEECKKALHAVSKVVRKCNEGARTMERTEMMYTINSQLDFKIKPFPLVSSSRWMVKRGELTALVEDNGIFLKRTARQQVYFFLFNDVLIVTRKKRHDSYSVIDYALRDQIWVGPCQPEELNLSPVRSTASMLSSRQAGANHLFRLRFLSNHSGEKVPMILGTEVMNERARWISALGQKVNKDEREQDRTNAMQVEVIRTYTAKQPDELSLQVADVVLVSQTVEDGWYEGERLRDGERGWFLAECGEPITCQATIQRNVQRMDRLQGLETNV
ncbi:rho guanine nucleotide exchange factor 26-like [Nerophis lumbriciformis]|uniref:rho guanine nucleotide exchange factor 26-like n=1 Tax=Nerophis lumbriciformis TaxID=546530 RepID=UPI002ADFDB2A|nr:rho guanine nucleotide exchange factor 26-like [Nerophis lumbriciformis]XP_061829081.1 rho guanine nucleotide exchange factor 26-like [Nerophis lumbriciformis]XP_061829082.1 rho guanine nucleotide exchange factor 26-like [Nerophis lumbriciformis]XP_061829083.1 rho guanine nucleotide exchange factor 26-like [Nerophis lumbriciformis]